ncbi:hypothetical protein BV22DRAFT_1041476 [Leucogyrophana mollusca]|uniref:Uncharacterized protein n=1 Tax=Leucogyrophana mollusca TaxID=85980 RepID=A0ACB8B0U2_9AGAM|nr:hypothetical protein BV22DRAFT_1041476 [Leucogyrophana mollusca]
MNSTPDVFKAWSTFVKGYDLNASYSWQTLIWRSKKIPRGSGRIILKAEIARFERGGIDGGPVAQPGALDLLTGGVGIWCRSENEEMYAPLV